MPGTREVRIWVPVGLLGVGCALLLLAKGQEVMPLAQPLPVAVSDSLLDRPGWDMTIPEQEQRVAGMDEYVLRTFGADSTRYDFSVYVGYYEAQTQGRTIHSPRNCLPGAGWEIIGAGTSEVQAAGQTHVVNRYILGNRNARALVYYWYQGRGRVAANEYAVKWELLRDKAVHGRSEEALVRIVVPMRDLDEAAADSVAREAARTIIPQVFRALPSWPGRTAA